MTIISTRTIRVFRATDGLQVYANDGAGVFSLHLSTTGFRRFVELGFKLIATHGTARKLEEAGMEVERVYKVKEGRPNVVDLIKGDRIQLVINTPAGPEPWFDEKSIRRAGIPHHIQPLTPLAAARGVSIPPTRRTR